MFRAQNAGLPDPQPLKMWLVGSAPGVIGLLREASHKVKECLRLASENIHIRKTLQSDRCRVLRGCRTNDRTYRQFAAEESSWLGHDQIRLQILTDRILGQVGESHT